MCQGKGYEIWRKCVTNCACRIVHLVFGKTERTKKNYIMRRFDYAVAKQ